MGNHFLSRRQYEMTKPISLLGHLALLVVLFAAIFDNVKVNASPMDPLKRGRSASSLIPFPRVGRSVEAEDDDSDRSDRHSRSAFNNRLLYGQKRTGKSSLIPFPRVGRSDPAWGSSARGMENFYVVIDLLQEITRPCKPFKISCENCKLTTKTLQYSSQLFNCLKKIDVVFSVL